MFTSKFEKLCNEYRENKRMIEELTAMNDDIKNNIIALMAGRDTMIEGSTKATYKDVISSRFDSKDFSKAYPDLFEKYSKPVAYKRFMVY